jgi:hypothetical protein
MPPFFSGGRRSAMKLPSRKRLFNGIRALASYLSFEAWEVLMDFRLKSSNPPAPNPKAG